MQLKLKVIIVEIYKKGFAFREVALTLSRYDVCVCYVQPLYSDQLLQSKKEKKAN